MTVFLLKRHTVCLGRPEPGKGHITRGFHAKPRSLNLVLQEMGNSRSKGPQEFHGTEGAEACRDRRCCSTGCQTTCPLSGSVSAGRKRSSGTAGDEDGGERTSPVWLLWAVLVLTLSASLSGTQAESRLAHHAASQPSCRLQNDPHHHHRHCDCHTAPSHSQEAAAKRQVAKIPFQQRCPLAIRMWPAHVH